MRSERCRRALEGRLGVEADAWLSVEVRAMLVSDDPGVILGRRALPKGRMSPRLNPAGLVGERTGEVGMELERDKGERRARLVVL